MTWTRATTATHFGAMANIIRQLPRYTKRGSRIEVTADHMQDLAGRPTYESWLFRGPDFRIAVVMVFRDVGGPNEHSSLMWSIPDGNWVLEDTARLIIRHWRRRCDARGVKNMRLKIQMPYKGTGAARINDLFSLFAKRMWETQFSLMNGVSRTGRVLVMHRDETRKTEDDQFIGPEAD